VGLHEGIDNAMSLSGAYDPGNIFAKIVRGEAPCHKVFEDDIVLSFLDVFPQSRGHSLVILKAVQARNLLDLPADQFGPLFARVQKVAGAMTRALNPDGLRLVQFNGAPAGQTVFHLHVHIVPVYAGVAMAGGHGQGPMADPAKLAETAALIAAAF
jgi:histidine triad (HIT) family protein